MKRIFLILIFSSALIAQPDWERWEAKEVNYELQSISQKSYDINDSSLEMTILSTVKNGYYFFISDLDGDNCPFYPSCSAFLVESVKQTNFIQGALMFSDRFTRDLNLFKDPLNYHLHESGKFYDPVENYSLNPRKFILFSESDKIEVK